MVGRSKDSKTVVPGIALNLRTLIWKGQLRPGEHLNQEEWATTLGVSPIPFREAVRILEGEGLLVVVANRGVTVTPVTAHELDEWTLEFKGLMYALLPLAVSRASPSSLVRARRIAKDLDLPNLPPGVHLEFWRTLFEPCGMSRLLGLVEQLIWRLGRYFFTGGPMVLSSLREVHPNREDFLDAIEAGDTEGAIQAALGFMQIRMNAYRKMLLSGATNRNPYS